MQNKNLPDKNLSVGFLEAILSGALYGLNPLFFLPIHELGYSIEATIFFRFLLASLFIFCVLLLKGKSIILPKKAWKVTTFGGVMQAVAAVCLFQSFLYMESGIAMTIFFANPVFVMIILVAFYNEKLEFYKVFFLVTTLIGIALLSGFFHSLDGINYKGVIVSLAGALAYALYMLSVRYAPFDTKKIDYSRGEPLDKKDSLSKELFSAYLFLICAFFALIFSLITDSYMLPRSSFEWLMIAGLSIVTTLLANSFLVSAIMKIGAILASILSAMEPITAVIIGVAVFNERVDFITILGVCIVIASVSLLTIIPILPYKELYLKYILKKQR